MAAVPLGKIPSGKTCQFKIYITTTTPTGSDRGALLVWRDRFPCVCPYDLALLRRFLQKIKPDLLILMETELWPKTIARQQQGIKILLANAGLSENGAGLSLDLITVASDAQRS